MAKEISYTTRPAPMPTARDELEELIETLSRAGALRALNGFVGRFEDVIEVVLDELNSPAGKRAVGALALLGEVLTKMPATRLQGLVESFDEGVGQAGKAMKDKSPSTFHVLRLARDPDVRRTLTAVFAILKVIGRELAEADAKEASGVKDSE